jgi:hypothetical protein
LRKIQWVTFLRNHISAQMEQICQRLNQMTETLISGFTATRLHSRPSNRPHQGSTPGSPESGLWDSSSTFACGDGVGTWLWVTSKYTLWRRLGWASRPVRQLWALRLLLEEIKDICWIQLLGLRYH